MNFSSIINKCGDKLLVVVEECAIVRLVDQYVDKMVPDMIDEWESSFLNLIFLSKVNLNEGLNRVKFFDKETLFSDPELSTIVEEAYHLLKQNGFKTSRYNGFVNIDVFDMNTTVPVETLYDIGSDNTISNMNVHSCVFYTRKDKGVKGDLDIYIQSPGLFDEGKKIVLPTISNMIMLRSGNIEYHMNEHVGVGKQYILSVHLEALE